MKGLLTGDLGRGFDQAVGQVVDWLGSDRQRDVAADGLGAPTLASDRLRLCRYTLVSVRRSAPRILDRGELMVSEGYSLEAAKEDLAERYLAGLEGQSDEGGAGELAQSLRVHLREVGSWLRPTLPAKPKRSAGDGEDQKPAPEGPSKKPAARKKAAKKRPAAAERKPVKARPRTAAGVSKAKKAPGPPPAGDLSDLDSVLQGLGGSATLAQLVKHTGASRAELRTALGQQIEAGTVERAGEGLKTLYRRRSSSR